MSITPGAPQINTPRGSIIQTGAASCKLTWSSAFQGVYQNSFTQAQKFVDSEVLRLSTPFIPIRTGMLIKSGQLGTVIGMGQARWIAPYARSQYYDTSVSRPYDPQRGAFWFERMKAIHKEEIISGAQRLAGGGA
jgi:hypothetical protein